MGDRFVVELCDLFAFGTYNTKQPTTSSTLQTLAEKNPTVNKTTCHPIYSTEEFTKHHSMKCKPCDNVDDYEDEYKMVPPEGGWGYIICAGLSIMFVACTAHLPVFGFIYNDFLESRGEGTSGVTLVLGVFSVMVAFGGFISNIALKKFSLRQVGLCGAMIYTVGCFLAIFVQTVSHLIITNGFIQGAGFGVMIPIAYTSFNCYFTGKRVLYLSLCKSFIGLCTMLYPLVMKVTMEELGFRGTLTIICAMGSHTILSMVVMQPVEWHSVKVQIQRKKPTVNITIDRTISVEEERIDIKRSLLSDIVENNQEEDEKSDAARTTVTGETGRKSSYDLRDTSKLTPLLMQRKATSTPLVTLGADEGKFNSSDNIYMENLFRATSISSLGTFGNIGLEPLPPIKNTQGKWQTYVDFLDLSLLKDPTYCSISFGMAFAFFADQAFFALEPLALYKYNFDNSQITTCISLGGAGDMAARILLALFGKFFHVSSRYLFFSGALGTAVLRIIFVQFENYTAVLVLTTAIGALRSLIHIPMPLVIAEHIAIERYPAAYGLFMLIQGVVNLSVGPVVGIVRDLTGSYALAFNLLTLCNMMCVIPWIIEAVMIKTRRKSKAFSKSRSEIKR